MRLKDHTKEAYSIPNWNPAAEGDQEQKKDEKPEKVKFSEYLLLTLTGYGVILIPTVLVIVGLCLLSAWLFGACR